MTRPALLPLALIALLALPPSFADETRLVVRPAEIEVSPGAEVVVTASLVQGERVERAEPWAFRFEADLGSLRGNLFRAPEEPGRYVVRVLHPASGLRGEAAISVPFPRPAVQFEIVPVGRELEPGERITCRAVARDRDGKEMAVRPLWRATRGRIGSGGAFQAPADGGACTVTALGPGAHRAVLEVQVRSGEPAFDLVLDPANLQLEPGRKVTLTLRKKVPGMTATVPPWDARWSASGGSLEANVWTAPDAPGDYAVVVETAGARTEARFQVRRLVRPVARIRILPETATLRPGQSIDLRAAGEAADGSAVEFQPAWRASAGSIDRAGRFQAPAAPGEVEIGVTDPGTGIAAKVAIRVAFPDAARLVLSPEKAVVHPGERARFEVQGSDAEGRPTPVEVDWSATGGSIDAAGWFAAGEAYGDSYQVVARDRKTGRNATAAVMVEPWPAVRIVIEPGATRVQAGLTVSFQAHAADGAGRPVPAEWRWRASAGSIDETGLFRAPEAPGEVEVVATETGSGKEAAVRVVVTGRPAASIDLTPSSLRLAAGEISEFRAKVLDSTGREVGGRVVFSAQGGAIDGAGRYQAGKEPGTAFRVTARHEPSGLEASATVEVYLPDVWTVRLDPARAEVEIGGAVAILPVLEKNGAPITALLATFEFSTDPPARVGPDGRFTAPAEVGRFTVRVRHRATGAVATAEVTVRAPQPARIVLEPTSAELRPGQTVRFQARALDAAGRTLSLAPEFRAEGGEIGADGTYRAGETAGDRFRVYAYLKDTKLVATADVKIVAVDYRIELAPDKATVGPGETVTFQSLLYSDGKRVYAWPWAFRYEAGAGRFQENVYRAPEKAGTYEVRVRHERGSAVAQVVVRPGPAARVVVVPEKASVVAGEEVSFSATAFDGYGNQVEGTFQWRSTGGQVDARGLFRAGASSGRSYEVTATLSGSTVAGKSTVEIRVPEVRYRLRVSPERIEVAPGEMVDFKVELLRDAEVLETRPWELEYEAEVGSFRGARYVAPDQAGTYEVRVRHQRASATVVVVVRPAAEIARLVIEPAEVTLAPGGEQQFIAIASDAKGGKVPAVVRWVAYGGEIDAEGFYQAPEEMGNFMVTARVPGTKHEANARVTVLRPDSVRLVVQPEEATVLPGERVVLKVTLFEGGREKMVWPWDLEFRTEAGRMEESTYVAPAQSGSYSVEIVHRKARTAAKIVVKAPSVSRVDVSPSEVRLRPGESQVFRATCLNEAGADVASTVRWEASGGSIDETGRFTAGEQGGEFRVAAVEPESGVRKEATVVVAVETRYLGLGRSWGQQIQRGRRAQNDLVNYVIANIFFRSEGEIADFHLGFVEGYGTGGEEVYLASWQTVLFEFGRYYGREYRRQTIGLDEAARFVSRQVLPLSPGEVESFRRGFLAGHTLNSATSDFDRILKLARG